MAIAFLLVTAVPLIFVALLAALVGWQLSKRGIGLLGVIIGVVFSALLFIATPTILHLAMNLKAYERKEGRVIDAITKQGMADVVVVATAGYSVAGFEGSSTHDMYKVTTRTDASGNYTVPSRWDSVVLWFPPIYGSSPHVSWTLTAFKAGFASSVDDSVVGGFWRSPSSIWLGPVVRMAPIEMRVANLSIRDAAAYYAAVTSGAAFADIEPIYRKLTNEMCEQPPDSPFDGSLIWSLISLRHNAAIFRKKLEQLEPESSRELIYDHRVRFRADHICEALRAAAPQ